MHKKHSGRLAVLLAFLLILVTAVPVMAVGPVNPDATFSVESDSWEGWPAAPSIGGQAGCVMDYDTGEVLFSKGATEPRYPASITKIMTAVIILKNCDLNAEVSFTETGIADAYNGSSNIAPTVGETFTVYQMLQMLLCKSANDVATQLAEYEAGSVEAFADQMNAEASAIGCVNTHFANANGLEDDWHYTCAYDMALIMREALTIDTFREIISSTSVTIPATAFSGERVYETHVQMINPASEWYYEGGIGGKTGYTDISQNTLAFSASRNGRTLIGIILTATDGNLINQDMGNLMNYGFDNFTDLDMSYGFEMLSGGTALVPNGVQPINVETEAIPADDNVVVNFMYNDQKVGTATMTQDTYHEYATTRETENPALKPTEAVTQAATPDAAISEDTDSSDSSSAKMTPGQTSTIMHIIMIVLSALIVLCIILLILSIRKQKKRKKNH